MLEELASNEEDAKIIYNAKTHKEGLQEIIDTNKELIEDNSELIKDNTKDL